MKFYSLIVIMIFTLNIHLEAELLRVYIAGEAEVSLDNPEGSIISLSYVDSALINLKGDLRFFRGIQFDLIAPSSFTVYREYMASALYNNLSYIPQTGIADIACQQLFFDALPNRIINSWQIPIRSIHGMRTSPYVTVPTGVIPPVSFPVLFRLVPVFMGINEELENMVFRLQVKPVLADEGAIRIRFIYPQQLPDKPVYVLIDDKVIDNPYEEVLLKEGEHHLLVLSEDYRNESRRFIVERAKIIDLIVELQDPTPLFIFESPDDAIIYVNNRLITNTGVPYPVEPGIHEVRMQMSNYSIIRPVVAQKGKTYRITLSIDMSITEND